MSGFQLPPSYESIIKECIKIATVSLEQKRLNKSNSINTLNTTSSINVDIIMTALDLDESIKTYIKEKAKDNVAKKEIKQDIQNYKARDKYNKTKTQSQPIPIYSNLYKIHSCDKIPTNIQESSIKELKPIQTVETDLSNQELNYISPLFSCEFASEFTSLTDQEKYYN